MPDRERPRYPVTTPNITAGRVLYRRLDGAAGGAPPFGAGWSALDDIIASKQHANRAKDQHALLELEELRRGHQQDSADT
jgi:hypothetical protein